MKGVDDYTMTTSSRIYKNGDLIKIICEEHPLFNEVAEVRAYNVYTDKYEIKTHNGEYYYLHPWEMGVYMTPEEDRKLNVAMLNALANISLDMKSKSLFEFCLYKLREV